MTHQEIKAKLLEKLSFVKEHVGARHGVDAQIDFAEFVCESDDLATLIHDLLAQDKLSPRLLSQLFDDYMLSSMIRKEKPILKLPKFYNQDIEDKYHLKQKFIELVKNEHKYATEGKIQIDFNKRVIKPTDETSYFLLQQFTNYLVDLLEEKQRVDDSKFPALHFDPEKSRLYVRKTEIKIRKFSDQYNILKVIFEKSDQIGKEWFFSEISEILDLMETRNDKKYYNAIYQIQNKLNRVGYTEFFIPTMQSAKINPKYLS